MMQIAGRLAVVQEDVHSLKKLYEIVWISRYVLQQNLAQVSPPLLPRYPLLLSSGN